MDTVKPPTPTLDFLKFAAMPHSLLKCVLIYVNICFSDSQRGKRRRQEFQVSSTKLVQEVCAFGGVLWSDSVTLTGEGRFLDFVLFQHVTLLLRSIWRVENVHCNYLEDIQSNQGRAA
ncbi:hypothetical protein RND71_008209 [Anisodus tanguticus]|uniref:Uncharacterized protein n=1 Tax=Anisodus tanguticus TaxID=243964 RepID=A0AAE1SMT5_9SOLA|nr:hypothetical protein RND71_008209 [Anisodus tanguticus]